MNHKKVYQKRLQSLDKGKAKSLGPVEKLTMVRPDLGCSGGVPR